MIRKILGIILIVIGVGLYFTGNYIQNEVDAGKKKIKSAQQTVNTGKALTDTNKVTKGFGDIVASPIQRKIDEGRHDAAYYASVAYWTHLSAVIVTIFGIIIFCLGFVNRKKS